MNMIYHDLAQGSPEWHAHRATHFNASDAPVMMGCSPYMTRSELLARLKTGITPEVDAGTQRRFDDGHRFEALARPLAQKIIGDELYPVTGSRGELSASFDGLTLDGLTAFEHKTLGEALRYTPWDEGNGDHLPLQYRVQMEQQMHVSGAELVLFMASKWDGETLVEERHCWYASDPELRAQIIAGWKQFEIGLAEFVPEVKAAPVVAAPVETLPAVSVTVQGELAIVSNLPAFGEALRSFISKIPEQPSTDQEFADTEAACKALKRAEEALDAAESNALAQLSDVDTMRRFVADYKALARATRLQREKLVAQRKEAIRLEIVQAARDAISQHIRELNTAMPADYMPGIPVDFAGCIRGLKSVDSIRNAVDTELARAKIAAGEVAKRIHINVAHAASNIVKELVPDLATLVLKDTDDFAAVVAHRKAVAVARLEAERERIRTEEAARLEREAEAKAADKAEADRREKDRQAEIAFAELMARQQADRDPSMDGLAFVMPAEMDPVVLRSLESKLFVTQKPQSTDDNSARITLGQINGRLSPVSISVAGLSELGFDPVEQVKASRLYRESDLPAICRAISKHVLAAAQVEAA